MVRLPDLSDSKDSSAAGTTRGYPPPKSRSELWRRLLPGRRSPFRPRGSIGTCVFFFSPELHSPRPPGAFTVESGPAQGGTALGVTRTVGCFSSFRSRSPTPFLPDPARWGRSGCLLLSAEPVRSCSANSQQGPLPTPRARSSTPSLTVPASPNAKPRWGGSTPWSGAGRGRWTCRGEAQGAGEGRLPRGG